MGYRLPEERLAGDAVVLDDTITQSTICVDNGSVSYVTVPVYRRYDRSHNRMIHDHFGWPSPDNPDHSCQLPPGEEYVTRFERRNLVDEGYTSVRVAMTDAPIGLTMEGTISGGEVILKIFSQCTSAISEDVEVPFAAFLVGSTVDYLIDGYAFDEIPLRDVVMKGKIHIVAGPIR